VALGGGIEVNVGFGVDLNSFSTHPEKEYVIKVNKSTTAHYLFHF